MEKTNVMRFLDVNKTDYTVFEYDPELTDGEKIAEVLGQDPDSVFKTLVTVGNDKQFFVFCIPVNCSLNLKKAAKAVDVKSIEMIRQKELLPLTGYVHGGCSPIGMKKAFKTIFNETAEIFDKITFSAGKRGLQVQLSPQKLMELINGKYYDLTD